MIISFPQLKRGKKRRSFNCFETRPSTFWGGDAKSVNNIFSPRPRRGKKRRDFNYFET
ncbi:MAG: hypothetical protein LBR79_06970 [Oscillospiraceae bacterium]|nr:hypothetical protein [Oscillospiraceae bacterium]